MTKFKSCKVADTKTLFTAAAASASDFSIFFIFNIRLVRSAKYFNRPCSMARRTTKFMGSIKYQLRSALNCNGCVTVNQKNNLIRFIQIEIHYQYLVLICEINYDHSSPYRVVVKINLLWIRE